MSITFRVTSDDDRAIDPSPVTVRQLVAFCNFACEQAIISDADADDDDITARFAFEASICAFPLSVIAKIFDLAIRTIGVIDEAQFRQCKVRFF